MNKWGFFLLGIFATVALAQTLPNSLADRQMQSYRMGSDDLPVVGVSIIDGTVGSSTEAINEATVTCSDTSATLAIARSTRRSIRYVNLSATQTFVCTGSDPCLTTVGVPINQFLGFSDTDWHGLYTCITASGSSDIQVREVYTQ